jgi:release factor glutamine methyltransferase
MFVSDNSIASLKRYFNKELADLYSEREIKMLLKYAVAIRFQLDDTQLLLLNEMLLSESDLLYFRNVIKRLRQNEPAQYIFEYTHFYGLKLKVDARALIPRPETEELVQWVRETYVENSPKILDLCAGSGCIALALKSAFHDSEVLGIDVSTEAIALARENAILTGLNVDFEASDVLNDDLKKYYRFDCWVTNPPYIPLLDKLNMKENVLLFEPHLALFVENEDALVFYRKIGEKAILNLINEGYLFLEIHELYAIPIIELLQSQGFVNIQLRKDLQGKDRMIRAQKPKFTP